jgi:diguanylate cyclase (GGDEF)-like protein
MTIAALNLRTRLENQSIRDSLTGLFNRHFMQISLERELARAARRKQTLAVVMLDLDHFKNFNDAHGHGAGDTVLKAIAAIFQFTIRSEDFACRYGGEEFTVILPDITSEAALQRVEAIRKAVENLRVPLEDNVFSDFTVSIGVALYPEDGEAAEMLLRRADLALYRAKRLGRNQVSFFEAKDPVV